MGVDESGHYGLAGQVDFLRAARGQRQDFVIAADSEEPSPGYGSSFSLRLTRSTVWILAW